MEMVFYCGDCKKFFYAEAEPEQVSSVCVHCGSEVTIVSQISKEMYSNLPSGRKEQWKESFRNLYPSQKEITEEYCRLRSILHRKKIMGVLFTLSGSFGRTLTVCKNKCIIKTDVTVGSLATDNATDGEKVIFFKNCTGLQFKESGLTSGYLQFEATSAMNNQKSNFFSESTFTFFSSNGGLTNEVMRDVFYYVMELIENCASGKDADVPEYPAMLAEYLQK